MTVETQKETLEFQTEVRQLLGLMIHSLYSNKEIFLRELISNASDACDKLRFEALSNDSLFDGDSELKVCVGFDKENRTVTISDNGIGMTAEEQDKAFQRFYQASPAKEGIGLGLNISRMIVERFGGTIRVSSDGPGRGAEVVTELPLTS